MSKTYKGETWYVIGPNGRANYSGPKATAVARAARLGHGYHATSVHPDATR